MNLLKRILIFAAMVALCSFIIRIARCDSFGGVPWPSHIEWSRYDVPSEGWLLVRPATEEDAAPDSVKYYSMPLPVGAELYVPRRVAGRGQDGDTELRGRSTSR
jgi:hypothetical protein